MKKFILLSATILLFSSMALAQMQSGKFVVSKASNGYTLDKNTGDRSYLLEVNYPIPFDKKKPTIVLSVTGIDAEKEVNLRYKVEAISVSRDNFTIKISTWSDSRIYELDGTWLAYTE